jgi:hypothetical protein
VTLSAAGVEEKLRQGSDPECSWGGGEAEAGE